MGWSEFAIQLDPAAHRLVVLTVTEGLHEIRRAAEIVHDDGDLSALRQHVAEAMSHQLDAWPQLLAAA